MATWKDQTQAIGALRKQRDAVDRQLYATGLQLKQLQIRLQQAMQNNPDQVPALQQQIGNAEISLAANKDNLATARANLNNAISTLYGDAGPQQAVSQLSDNIPVTLLPVRMETRFNTADPKQPELWLRIYPDDIAIETHEKTLTDVEVDAGKKYWVSLFNAIKSGGSGAADRKKTAWSDLVSLFGANRSAWVALQTKPTNWVNDGTGVSDALQLSFPAFDLTKTQAWSRAPRTRVMPDKFVVMLYTGDSKVIEVTGNLVPDELIVGPDPLDAANSFVDSGGRLNFGPDFDWASDFNKAIDFGLGFKISITPQQATQGFDKIIALGLYISGDESDSQQLFEDLIDSHHYSPKGFSLLPQGSPTNNTSGASSSFSKSDPFDAISYFVETGDPLFLPSTDCDGKNLADALGIRYDPLQFIRYSDATDNRQAVLMNKALHAGTLGYYINSLLKPVLSDASQQWLGDFFMRFVTGRGPLPAFRVGNQPYGVLLTSDFSAWKWQRQEQLYPLSFLNTLYAVLNDYYQIWKGLEAQLIYAGKPGTEPSSALMNILGLQPGSANFVQRNAYSTDNLYNLAAFQYGDRYYADMQNSFNSKNEGLNWLSAFGYHVVDPNGKLQVPQILRLVYQHTQTTLDPANVVDNIPLSESDPIHYYDTANKKNYLNWLAQADAVDALQQQQFGDGIAPPTSLLYLMLRKSLLQSLHTGSVNWFQTNGVDFTDTLGVMNFHNIRLGGDLTKWEVMQAPIATAIPGHPQANMAIANYLLGVGQNDAAATVPAYVKEALSELASKPSAALARCFTEHIDTLTYRLDSWQTGLFTLRLNKMRNLSNADPQAEQSPRNTGLWLGAYGWLENIRPSARQQVPAEQIPLPLQPTDQSPVYRYSDNGGYVHAPSINHASAAAILRSGYLSHANVGAPDALSVNLSSERVRRAMLILEGMRNGQPIEAVLGYQFERGLHDRASKDSSLLKLNDYIYDFRDKYKITQNLVQQQGAGTQETIPANNVVNGLDLSQTTLAFPYGATGDVTSASTDEIAAIEAEKDNLADSLDAVKDLLTVESVYQLVLGNFDRAGAVLNSIQDATVPPVLESIDTPRGSHFSFTNRVAIQFANGDPAAQSTNPWYPVPMTARAMMETGLNKWLKTIIGEAVGLAVQVSQQDGSGNLSGTQVISVDQLGIQPIDLVYLTATQMNTGAAQQGNENKTGASELESRIAYAYRSANNIPDSSTINISFLQPQNSAGKRPLGEMLPLLRTLKSMITDSRYLNAQDFNPPALTGIADPNNPKGFDVAELTGRINRAQTAYQQLLQGLVSIPITAQIDDGHGTVNVYNTLGDTFTALDSVQLDFSNIVFDFTDGNAAALQNQLKLIANAGLGEAFPQRFIISTNPFKQILLDQGRSIAKRMQTATQQAITLIGQAAAITDPEKATATLIRAGKFILDDSFNILPVFTYNNETDVMQSNMDRDQLLHYASTSTGMIFPADEWMQNAASARPRLARWDYIRTLAETANIALEVKPIQLPYKAKDSWIAVEFPATDPFHPDQPFALTQDTISIVLHGEQSFATGVSHCGLMVDDWVETIPTENEMTGISFNYNQPNAFPPQAILLAVPPVVKGQWDWDELVGILTDSLLRAKLRAVEPQLLATVNKVQTSVLLPALLASFTQFDLDIALDYRLNLGYVSANFPITAIVEENNS